VLVTRPRRQSAALARPLRANGAAVIDAPTVRIASLGDWTRVDAALRALRTYRWLIVTSANGVSAAVSRMRKLGLDARDLAGLKIAAIGPATELALRRRFLRADVVPAEYEARALSAALRTFKLAGQRCLLLRSDHGGSTLPESLTAAGAICHDVVVYRTVRPEALPSFAVRRLRRGDVDWATFTSSSTFSNFVSLLGTDARPILRRLQIASIGPITSATIRAAGYSPTVEAAEYTAAGLVRAITQLASIRRASR